jgi:hypothetical protein
LNATDAAIDWKMRVFPPWATAMKALAAAKRGDEIDGAVRSP